MNKGGLLIIFICYYSFSQTEIILPTLAPDTMLLYDTALQINKKKNGLNMSSWNLTTPLQRRE